MEMFKRRVLPRARNFQIMRMGWALPCAFILLLASCAEKEKPATVEPTQRTFGTFALSLDSTERVADSITVDLNSDGVSECIITVGPRFADTSAPKMFSLIHVFEFNRLDSAWRSIFVDAVDNGEALYFRDVTGSGSPEVIVETNAGGNDPINARGAQVYGFRADNVFTLLFYSASGQPEFTDLNADGVAEILVLGEYWGVSSRAEAFVYTAGVFSFDGTMYKEANAQHASYYRRVIAEQRRAYKAASQGTTEPMELYRAAMSVLLWLAASGDVGVVTEFWRSERTSLRAALPDELYDELDYFVEMEQSGYTQPLAEGRP